MDKYQLNKNVFYGNYCHFTRHSQIDTSRRRSAFAKHEYTYLNAWPGRVRLELNGATDTAEALKTNGLVDATLRCNFHQGNVQREEVLRFEVDYFGVFSPRTRKSCMQFT